MKKSYTIVLIILFVLAVWFFAVQGKKAEAPESTGSALVE